MQRYRGHLSLPGVGLVGQQKLARGSVLCVGTGGLGSPAALYLAAAGVGRLGLVDADVVEVSNLHRQILFGTADLGKPKAPAAAARLAQLNPEVQLVVHQERLTAENAEAILAGYDVVLDGTDNFATRYAINDACARLGKPDVWASVYRFEGQLSVFDASRGPCYRCLFPEVPAEDAIPACAEAGVLGVLPGVLGTAQALEALKLLLGVGEPLVGRLQVFDGLGQRWQELALEKDPACAVCGGERPAPRRAEQRFPEALEPEALQARLDAGEALTLLDCREPFEWEICHLAGSTLMPMGQLALDAIPRERPVVVVCHHGPRSVHVASYLLANGYPEVAFLDGGLLREVPA